MSYRYDEMAHPFEVVHEGVMQPSNPPPLPRATSGIPQPPRVARKRTLAVNERDALRRRIAYLEAMVVTLGATETQLAGNYEEYA